MLEVKFEACKQYWSAMLIPCEERGITFRVVCDERAEAIVFRKLLSGCLVRRSVAWNALQQPFSKSE